MTDIAEQPPLVFPTHVQRNLAELVKATDPTSELHHVLTLASPAATTTPPVEQKASAAELASIATHLDQMAKTDPPAKVVRVASAEVGYHEHGDNDTKYGAWYGMNRTPWCDIFVSWVFNEAGELAAVGGKHSYVPQHVTWFHQHGRLHLRGAKGAGPRVGCVVFFDLNQHDGTDHVGIVTAYTDTEVHTVEGNRANAVRRVKYARSSHQIFAYGYPIWK